MERAERRREPAREIARIAIDVRQTETRPTLFSSLAISAVDHDRSRSPSRRATIDIVSRDQIGSGRESIGSRKVVLYSPRRDEELASKQASEHRVVAQGHTLKLEIYISTHIR